MITELRFSTDGLLLAVGSVDTNIYVYKMSEKKNIFVKFSICRAHMGSISHIDFSANSQYLRSNSADEMMFFWDVRGKSWCDFAPEWSQLNQDFDPKVTR